MKKWYLLLIVFLGVVPSHPTQAAWPFGKKARPDPAQRVPELISVLKADQDERKRAYAAEELRDYDPRLFPQITPVLIDALANEKTSWRVRLEAATTLGRQRPLPPEAAQALEHAAVADESLRVRMQAKSALFWSGHRGSKQKEMSPLTNNEGPLLAPPTPNGVGANPKGTVVAPQPGPQFLSPAKGLRPTLTGQGKNQAPKGWPPAKTVTEEPPLVEPPAGGVNAPLPLPITRQSPMPTRPTMQTWRPSRIAQPASRPSVPVRTVPEPTNVEPGPLVTPTPPRTPPMEEDGPILTPPRP